MKKIDKRVIVYYCVILVVFLFTRCYRLGELPMGLHIDEVSMMYNTWALTEFGVDRYNVSYPVYFDNTGSGQSCLYVYMAVFLSKIFGYSLITFRAVSVILGLILLAFGTQVAYKIIGKFGARVMAVVITIMPVFLMSERWGYDCNAMLPMFTMMMFFLLQMIDTGKKRYAILTGISISLCLYSYVLAYVMVPAFLVCVVFYLIFTKKFRIKDFLLSGAVAFICSAPLIYYVGVIYGLLPEIRTDFISITAASVRRTEELTYKHYRWKELFSDIVKLTLYDDYNFMAIKEYGVFYMNTFRIGSFEISLSQILILAGAILIIKETIVVLRKREFKLEALVLFAIVTNVGMLLILGEALVYRHNAVYSSFALLITYALWKLYEKKILWVYWIIVVVYIGNFVGFCSFYFGGEFEEEYKIMKFFDSSLVNVAEEIKDYREEGYTIHVDHTASFCTYLLMLYGMKIEPSDFDASVENLETSSMKFCNISIGVPEKLPEGKHIYVIKNLDNETRLYLGVSSRDIIPPKEVYKTILNNQKTLHYLLETETKVYDMYGYYVIVTE